MTGAAVDPFLVAQAEVDAEVDAEADEQHREGHRNQIELAQGKGGEAGGPYQPHDQGGEGGGGQSRRPQSDQQQADDEGQRQDRGQAHPFLDTLELLVGQRRRPGQTDAHPMRIVQLHVAGQVPHGAEGGGGRLQGPEIEGRLNDDEAAFIACAAGVARHQFLPRQVSEAPRRLRPDNRGHGVQRRPDLDRDAAVFLEGFVDDQLEHPEQAAQAGVPPQGAEERLRLGQPVADVEQLVHVQIQQPVPAHERLAQQIVDLPEQVRPLAQPRRQRRRRVFRQVRGFPVDDDQDGVRKLREGFAHRLRLPAEWQFG